MKDYKVTKFVAGLGFYVAIGLVAFSAIAGFFSSGFSGLLFGLVLGAFLCVPFMMLCEGMHALVTIANNTKKDSQLHEYKKSA